MIQNKNCASMQFISKVYIINNICLFKIIKVYLRISISQEKFLVSFVNLQISIENH